MTAAKKYIMHPLIGITSLILHSLNALACFIALLVVLFVAIFTGVKKVQRVYYYLPILWADIANKIFHLSGKMHIEVKYIGEEIPLSLQDFYLVTANHQSWSDILVMFYVFNKKIPMLKFFAKKVLLWLPIVGQTCWLYGYPFLHRHTQAELKKHPEWRKKDILATKKACERFKESPGSLVIYAEGTRFSEKKRLQQHSPFRFLLKPKTGGLSLALNCMGDRIKTLIDVTILYPQMEKYNFWDYCCGKVDTILVYVKPLAIPENMRGDMENDADYRQQFQKYMHRIWQEKDNLMSAYYHDNSIH